MSSVASRPLGSRTRSCSTRNTRPLNGTVRPRRFGVGLLISGLLIDAGPAPACGRPRRGEGRRACGPAHQAAAPRTTACGHRPGARSVSRAACRNGRADARNGRQPRRHALARAAVQRVADDRMARLRSGARESDASVRCRSRGARATRRRAAPRSRTRVTAGRPRARAARHLLPMPRVAADRPRDRLAGRAARPTRAPRIPCRRSRSWNCRDRARCARSCLRHHHHARRAAIEPMDDAGPLGAADAAEAAQMVEQRVDQRAARVAGRRDARPCPAGLFDDGDVRVVVEQRERQRLGRRRCGPDFGQARRPRRRPSHTASAGLARPSDSVTWPSRISFWICDRDRSVQLARERTGRAACPRPGRHGERDAGRGEPAAAMVSACRARVAAAAA